MHTATHTHSVHPSLSDKHLLMTCHVVLRCCRESSVYSVKRHHVACSLLTCRLIIFACVQFFHWLLTSVFIYTRCPRHPCVMSSVIIIAVCYTEFRAVDSDPILTYVTDMRGMRSLPETKSSLSLRQCFVETLIELCVWLCVSGEDQCLVLLGILWPVLW